MMACSCCLNLSTSFWWAAFTSASVRVRSEPAIRKRVSHALLSRRDVAAAKDVKQLRAFEVRRLRLFDDAGDGFMRDGFGHDHGHVTADRRKRRQWLEASFRVAARQQQIQIEFGHHHGIAQIVAGARGPEGVAPFRLQAACRLG